jgi:hypothetical protein
LVLTVLKVGVIALLMTAYLSIGPVRNRPSASTMGRLILSGCDVMMLMLSSASYREDRLRLGREIILARKLCYGDKMDMISYVP